MKNTKIQLFAVGFAFFVGYLLLGVVTTYPLIREFDKSVINNMYREADHTFEWGDHLQLIAGFREHKNYLENTLKFEPLLDKEFCMEDECKLSTYEFFKRVIFSPYWGHTVLNVFFDDQIVYNLSILLSFPFVGFANIGLIGVALRKNFQFQLSNLWLGLVGFVGSLFVVLAPIRLHHLFVGHKNGYMIGVFVLSMLCIEMYLYKKNKLWLWLNLIFFSFLSFSEQFFSYWGIIYFLIRIGWEELPNFRIRNLWKQLLLWIREYWIVGLTIILSSFVNYVGKIGEISNSNISSGRPFSLIEFYSPPSWSYLWTNHILEHEHNVYIGIVGIATLIFSLSIIVYRLIKKQQVNRFLILISISSVFFLVASLGSLTPVYKFLYDYLWGFNLSRTPVRAMFIFFPIFSVLFGIWIGYLIQNINSKYRIGVVSGLILLIFASLYSFAPTSLVGLPQTIGIQDNQKVLFLPIAESGHFFNSIYEFQISGANSTMINGYHPYRMSKMIEFEENMAGELNQSAINGKDIETKFAKELAKLGVDRVVILDEYLTDERIEKLK